MSTQYEPVHQIGLPLAARVVSKNGVPISFAVIVGLLAVVFLHILVATGRQVPGVPAVLQDHTLTGEASPKELL